MNEDRLLNLRQVADMLGHVSVKTVRRRQAARGEVFAHAHASAVGGVGFYRSIENPTAGGQGMRNRVYRRTRIINGRPKKARLYRAEYTVEGDSRIYDVALGVTDKSVAEKKLKELIAEKEKERWGIIPSKGVREAAQRPLMDHLTDFLASRETLERCPKYVAALEQQLRRLFPGCGWERVGDVTRDSFESWRNRFNASAKTRNEYLGAVSVFFNWLVGCGRMTANPLAKVPRVDTRGKEKKSAALSPMRKWNDWPPWRDRGRWFT